MDLKRCSATLFVKDITVSRRFYAGVLNLSVFLDAGKYVIFENGFAIWEIRPDHIIPAALGLEKITDTGINRFELYFETEELPRVIEILKEKKVRFLHTNHEEPWGQHTVRFFDPDSHLIEIGESMRQLVERLHIQGLTPEQISERTSLPPDEVKRLTDK